MLNKTILSRSDYEDYLIRVYFGSEKNALFACINRAYLDFCRTMHGYSNLPGYVQTSLEKEAKSALMDAMAELQQYAARSQLTDTLFDEWHKKTCQLLITIYRNYGHTFYVGQAQKWVNMTLKYIFTFGENRISGWKDVYSYCHVPFDNITLGALKRYGFSPFDYAWSRIDDYDEYINRQKWIRNKFTLVPLDVEFLLWAGRYSEVK